MIGCVFRLAGTLISIRVVQYCNLLRCTLSCCLLFRMLFQFEFHPRVPRDAGLGSRRLKMETRLPFSDRWRVSSGPTTPNHHYENSVYASVRVSFRSLGLVSRNNRSAAAYGNPAERIGPIYCTLIPRSSPTMTAAFSAIVKATE